MKQFNYIGQNQYLKVKLSPNFLITKSLPLFFHYEWDLKISITNKTDNFLALNSVKWEFIDNLGRVEITNELFFEKNRNYLLPDENYIYTRKTTLQSPRGILHGVITFKKENKPKAVSIKIPSTLLDSPFDKKIYH
jgi:uncharacterized protein affecting Mg2+/Co2+ transport